MDSPKMSAADAAATLDDLTQSGIRCWAMGGWGVDALLGLATREHHDLDLLVQIDDLPALSAWLDLHLFSWLYDWDENRPIDLNGRRYSTAFVAGHVDGRELDVHAVVVDDDVNIELATDDPWTLPPDALAGRGTIHDVSVACVSREAQRAMHVGYKLPAHHVSDLERLGLN